MDPKRNFGQSEAAVVVLPDLAFDLAEGKPLPGPAQLGKADMPVRVLEELAFDLQSLPVLQVTVQVRAEATPTQIGYDLYRLYVALNQLDLSLNGHGLTPDEATPLATSNGSCTVTFRPNRPEGAAQRFAQMADLINASQSAAGWLPTPMPAIAGYHAATAS